MSPRIRTDDLNLKLICWKTRRSEFLFRLIIFSDATRRLDGTQTDPVELVLTHPQELEIDGNSNKKNINNWHATKYQVK